MFEIIATNYETIFVSVISGVIVTLLTCIPKKMREMFKKHRKSFSVFLSVIAISAAGVTGYTYYNNFVKDNFSRYDEVPFNSEIGGYIINDEKSAIFFNEEKKMESQISNDKLPPLNNVHLKFFSKNPEDPVEFIQIVPVDWSYDFEDGFGYHIIELNGNEADFDITAGKYIVSRSGVHVELDNTEDDNVKQYVYYIESEEIMLLDATESISLRVEVD